MNLSKYRFSVLSHFSVRNKFIKYYFDIWTKKRIAIQNIKYNYI